MIPSNYHTFTLQDSSCEWHREDRGYSEILFYAIAQKWQRGFGICHRIRTFVGLESGQFFVNLGDAFVHEVGVVQQVVE